jgi:hypothetical protein
MNIKELENQFRQIFEQKEKFAGCKKCNGHGEIAVQDGGKFKSVPCGCDEARPGYFNQKESRS